MRRKGDEREVFFFRLAQKKGTRAERELSFSPKFLLFPLLLRARDRIKRLRRQQMIAEGEVLGVTKRERNVKSDLMYCLRALNPIFEG